MVDLPEPEEPTSAVTVPGSAAKADAVQHGLLRRVGELHILKAHRAFDGRHLHGAAGGLVLFELRHDLVRAVEAGKGLSQLRADVHDLEDRRDHEGEKHVVLEVVADRPRVAQHAMPAQPHHQRRHQAQHGGRGRREHAGHGQRLHHVLQQPLDAAGEDVGLALFGVIALDDAHAAQRLRQAAGDFGVDFAALAKDGADGLEAVLQKKDEDADD